MWLKAELDVGLMLMPRLLHIGKLVMRCTWGFHYSSICLEAVTERASVSPRLIITDSFSAWEGFLTLTSTLGQDVA